MFNSLCFLEGFAARTKLKETALVIWSLNNLVSSHTVPKIVYKAFKLYHNMWMIRNFRLVGHDIGGDWNNQLFHMLHVGLIIQIGNLLWLWFKPGADILCLSCIVVK